MKEDCRFSYRDSIFKNSRSIILAATFRFPEMPKEESSKRKADRLAFCKETQDNSKPNFGSVFSECSYRIMRYAQKRKLGNKRVHFSDKTANWLVNEGGGTYQDAISAIRKVEFLHKVFGKKCQREVIVWD